MLQLWQIIANKNECQYLCTTKTGKHYMGNKANRDHEQESVIFSSREKAQEYINNYLNDAFTAEGCYYDIDYLNERGMAID